jgi:hypothetical protein
MHDQFQALAALPPGELAPPGTNLIQFDFRQDIEIVLFSKAYKLALEPTQPPIQWVLEPISYEVKWPGCKTDHKPPSSVEVKNTWNYTAGSIPG